MLLHPVVHYRAPEVVVINLATNNVSASFSALFVIRLILCCIECIAVDSIAVISVRLILYCIGLIAITSIAVISVVTLITVKLSA